MTTEQKMAGEYTLRPPRREDAALVVDVMNACQAALGDAPDMSVDALLKDWVGTDLNDQAVLVVGPDGQVVGFADLMNRRYQQVNVYAYPLPGPHWAAVFAQMMQWGEAWASTHRHLGQDVDEVEVHFFRRANDGAACTALEAAGYENVRTHYVMAAQLTEKPPVPIWPAGVSARAYRPGQDDDALFLGGEESFQDMWNRPSSTKERWLLPTQAESFDPTLWFLPFDQTNNEVCGVCLCSILAGVGEVDTLGIRRPWRRQGLGLALLHHAFGEFWQRGVRRVRLSVDAESPTGAPRLYDRAGFRVEQQFARYLKRV
ncbi:MAG: GNAT family N-acetyltransferase [Caldilineaceae bacterium]